MPDEIKMQTKSKLVLACLVILVITARVTSAQTNWPSARANEWSAHHPWIVGCNYTPSTAINQLEMWQADTFDPVTIDRELGWAEQIGFSGIRVFLHNLLWAQDPKGLVERMDKFLEIAHRHHIGVMFVLFDSCWDPYPKLGKQHDPKPFVHNSGWVQSPGAEILAHPEEFDEILKPYVQGVIRRFRDDKRVDVWDVYNEPDNLNNSSYGKLELASKKNATLVLLQKTFVWAREVNPQQPLTSAVWSGDWSEVAKLTPIQKTQLEQSDVISFHCYSSWDEVSQRVQALKAYNRPILCTEYMARPNGSHFDPIMGNLKEQGVAAYSWGFVDGKTQTIFPWDSWTRHYTNEPSVWFHDIFRRDGRPFDTNEVEYIKHVTAKSD